MKMMDNITVEFVNTGAGESHLYILKTICQMSLL
jgi:hypothetical protein